MPQTLSGLRTQAALYLDDAAGNRYNEDTLTAAIRLALGEYNLLQAALGLPLASLAGLDGALATSLPAAHESMLVEGAAGHAAAMRAAGRGEIAGLDRPDEAWLADWSSRRLEAFRLMLEDVRAGIETQRLAGLRQADAAAFSPQGWPLDGWEGED